MTRGANSEDKGAPATGLGAGAGAGIRTEAEAEIAAGAEIGAAARIGAEVSVGAEPAVGTSAAGVGASAAGVGASAEAGTRVETRQIVLAHVPVKSTPYGEPVRPHVRRLILAALERAGYEAHDVAVRSRDDLERLAAVHPRALVFNLCYGLRAPDRVDKAGDSDGSLDQPGVAAALVELGLGLVGSDAAAQRRCQDKAETARLVAGIGVESPREMTMDEAMSLSGPFVVKPRQGAAHRGLRLVADSAALAQSPPTDDMMIQEYLDGPEYTVGVIGGDGQAGHGSGNRGERQDSQRHGDGSVGQGWGHAEGPMALPVVRIRNVREGAEPTLYDWATTTSAPDAPGRFGLPAIALELFTFLGLADYARFDFRVVPGRGPVLLDANALPNLAPRQLLATSARWAGIQLPELIGTIVASAQCRLDGRAGLSSSPELK